MKRPFVYYHDDTFIPECDCGDTEWWVELPDGWMWRDEAFPEGFTNMSHALDYANSLSEDHPDVIRIEEYFKDWPHNVTRTGASVTV